MKKSGLIHYAESYAATNGELAKFAFSRGNIDLAKQYAQLAWHWACYAERVEREGIGL